MWIYYIICSKTISAKSDSILEIIENKYVIIPLVLINYYLYEWDLLIGILFSIFLISLIFDYFIFINKGLKKIKNKNIDYENNKNIIENFTVNDNLKNMFQKLLVFLEIN